LDKKRVQQIINNLLSNAIKFTFRGGITLKLMLEDNCLDENRVNQNSELLNIFEEEKKEGDFLVLS